MEQPGLSFRDATACGTLQPLQLVELHEMPLLGHWRDEQARYPGFREKERKA